MIKVIVNGAKGKLGRIAVDCLSHTKTITLVATCTKEDSLAEVITRAQADVVVDVTTPDAVFKNAQIIIENGAHPVIGTSGLTPQQIQTLRSLCESKKLGGIIAPNFSIGALIMMCCAALAAKYFSHAEIIELHHDQKKDAPSGTAIKTAELISSVRKNTSVVCEEKLKGALGAKCEEVPIHSVRLPGLIADQEVLFGQTGETLSIKHQTINRDCFAPGILLACEKVVTIDYLAYGLEIFLD